MERFVMIINGLHPQKWWEWQKKPFQISDKIWSLGNNVNKTSHGVFLPCAFEKNNYFLVPQTV